MVKNNVQILIVDDEKEFCSLFKSFFELRGYNVDVAYTGEDALIKMKERSPNILLLDVILPGINGLEMLTHIHQFSPGTEIIITTVDMDGTVEERARKLEIADFIPKPVLAQKLESIVKGIASKIERTVK